MNTGGPAFPDWPESAFPSTFKSIGPEQQQIHRWGMTLRDYFAAKAMQACITGMANRRESFNYAECAAVAYEQADAMLKAREQ